MKKTLTLFLSCAALVAPALGAEPTFTATQITLTGGNGGALSNGDKSITGGNRSLTWNTNVVGGSLSSWMITLTIDDLSGNAKPFFSTSRVSANGGTLGIGLGYTHNGATIGLTNNPDASNCNLLADTPTLSGHVGSTYAFAYDSTASTLYLAEVGTQNVIQYTLASPSSYTTTLTSSSTNSATPSAVWTQGGCADMTIGMVTDMSALAGNADSFVASVKAGTATYVAPAAPSEAIPEPATATLSLLALAGLAARRRRR